MIKNEYLPFFGKNNSISKITKIHNDEEKYYLLTRYDCNGNEKKDMFRIPIKLETTRGIMEDYCRDLREYLIKYENKYVDYKKKKRVFNFNGSYDKLKLVDKLSKIGVYLGAGLIGFTFSIVSLPILFGIGMVVLVVSSVGMFVISDINKEIDEVKFINSYDEYSRRFNEYMSCLDNKMSNNPTKYKGLSNSKNKGNTLIKERKLVPEVKCA